MTTIVNDNEFENEYWDDGDEHQDNLGNMEKEYQDALDDMKKVIDLVGDRQVMTVSLLSNRCAESVPCRGHKGVSITLSDGMEIKYKCPSVSSGAIMVYYKHVANADVTGHCTNYIDTAFKNQLVSLLRICK
jgi:hypothetical protein